MTWNRHYSMTGEIFPKTIQKNNRLYDTIVKELSKHNIKAFVRIANQQKRYIIVKTKDYDYSVIRFAHAKTFRIFWPYPSNHQQSVDRELVDDVVAFFISKTI